MRLNYQMSSLQISMHAEQVKCTLSVTFMAEHLLNWLHLTEITSTYTAALSNSALNYAFQKGDTFPARRQPQSWMQLQTNVTTLMIHMYRAQGWIADSYTPEKNTFSSTLPRLVPVSPPALPPHLLVPRLPMDLWPSADPLLFPVPLRLQHPLASRPPPLRV